MEAHVILHTYFERKRKSSPRFSLRALAARVEVSASFLSRVLSGKKRVPDELLHKLALALDIEPELLQSTAPKESSTVVRPSTEVADWALAAPQTNQILRTWYYIPILELTTLKNFDGSAQMLARRLRLSIETVEVAVRELTSLGLLKFEKGRYRKADTKLRITSAKSAPLIRKFHDEMLERAQLTLRLQTQDEQYRVPSLPYDWHTDTRPDNLTISKPSLEDAQRTIGLVRSHASEWHVDPSKIGVIGFSAGGYLVAEISNIFNHRLYAPVDAVDKESCRPNFAMAIYPGHLWKGHKDLKLNPNIPVSKKTPPTFLVQAEDDHVSMLRNSCC